jgi:hypothetical protein
MSPIYSSLLENSLQAALSSIEIYNKPDFKYREQVFVIININAWELLLKAKILKDNSDDISSLYVYLKDGNPKTNRSGNPLTIEIFGAMKKLSLDSNVSENLSLLIEIRDTVTHFYSSDSLSYLVYTLGVASLKNYQQLIKQWFDRSLLDYNFYILPLGFVYNFKTLSLIDLEEEPEAVANIIQAASAIQQADIPASDFFFVCEVKTEIQSAKKLTGEVDFVTAVDPNSTEKIVIQDRNIIDKYPIDCQNLMERVRKAKPGIKQQKIYALLKTIKGNSKYSAYNFRTKQKRERYEKTGVLPSDTPSLYNEDAVRYVIENLEA